MSGLLPAGSFSSKLSPTMELELGLLASECPQTVTILEH